MQNFCWSYAHTFFYCQNHTWLSFTKTEFCKSSIWKENVAPIHFRKIIGNVHQHRISPTIDSKDTLFISTIIYDWDSSKLSHYYSIAEEMELILFCLGQIVLFHFKFLKEIYMGCQKMFAFFFSFFATTFWFSLAWK